MQRRLRIALIALFTAVFGILGILVPATAQAASVAYGATTAHPYSDPVWWPLAASAQMGCYHTNCGGSDHSTYLWDIVGEPSVNTQPVFAMGAGIVHVGATGQGCGHAQSRGNYLYVDHGNGVLTYYGHLGRMFVHTGEYVSPRTALAYMGNSGYSRCHTYPQLRYVMIALKHGGTNGRYVEIPATYACPTSGGSAVTWPARLPRGSASHWDRVRNKTAIPAASASRSCSTVPVRTPARPSRVGLAKHGKSTMYVPWSRASSSYKVTRTIVVLSMYHPSIHRWLTLSSQSLSGSAHYAKFHHLRHNRHYRVYVQFRNWWGYSGPSASHYASIGR